MIYSFLHKGAFMSKISSLEYINKIPVIEVSYEKNQESIEKEVDKIYLIKGNWIYRLIDKDGHVFNWQHHKGTIKKKEILQEILLKILDNFYKKVEIVKIDF